MKIQGFKLGATGRFPYGKADASDAGELRMALATDHANGIVRVEFGTPTVWLGLPAREARSLAALLLTPQLLGKPLNCPKCRRRAYVVCSNHQCPCWRRVRKGLKPLRWTKDGEGERCAYCGFAAHLDYWFDREMKRARIS